MGGKCTAQENNTMTQPGLKPSLLDLESNTCTNHKVRTSPMDTVCTADKKTMKMNGVILVHCMALSN